MNTDSGAKVMFRIRPVAVQNPDELPVRVGLCPDCLHRLFRTPSTRSIPVTAVPDRTEATPTHHPMPVICEINGQK